MSTLLDVFSEIKDRRRKQAKQYSLPHILLFCVVAILSGAKSYRRIHTFIVMRFAVLKKLFPCSMKHPPSYSEVRWLLVRLDANELEAAFRKHALDLSDADGDLIIAADGKTLCSSFDAMDERNAAQILNIFDTQNRIILAHVPIEDKSNEIPAMQQAIRELGLTGKLYTADSMHCQKKTFEAVRESGNHLLVQVKANQKHLSNAVKALPQKVEPADTHTCADEIAHGRQTTRVVNVYPAGTNLALPTWEKHVMTAVQVQRTTHEKDAKTGLWKTKRETAWYVTDVAGQSAQYYGHAIRSHWGVENPMHHNRDVTFGEDASRIRKNPGIMARIKSFGFNILSLNGAKNFADTVFRNCIDPLRIFTYAGV